MSDRVLTPDLPADLPQQEESQEGGEEGAEDPRDEEQSLVVCGGPAGGGEDEGPHSRAGAGLGAQQEGEVAAGEGRQAEEGCEAGEVAGADTEVEPDTVMVPPSHSDSTDPTHLPASLTQLWELRPQPSVGEEHPQHAGHQHQVLPPGDQLRQVPECPHTLHLVHVEESGCYAVGAVEEELGVGSQLDHQPDTEQDQQGQNNEEGEESCEEVETGQPDQPRHQHQGDCPPQGDSHCSTRPG